MNHELVARILAVAVFVALAVIFTASAFLINVGYFKLPALIQKTGTAYCCLCGIGCVYVAVVAAKGPEAPDTDKGGAE